MVTGSVSEAQFYLGAEHKQCANKGEKLEGGGKPRTRQSWRAANEQVCETRGKSSECYSKHLGCAHTIHLKPIVPPKRTLGTVVYPS